MGCLEGCDEGLLIGWEEGRDEVGLEVGRFVSPSLVGLVVAGA